MRPPGCRHVVPGVQVAKDAIAGTLASAPSAGVVLPGPRTDGEVIAASIAHPEQFEIIFERHYRAVLRFAVGRIGTSDGGDIAAEAFVRAFDRRARFKTDRESALPWLFGIAANIMRERARRRARRARAFERAASATIDAEIGGHFDGDAVDRVDAVARSHELQAALDILTDDEYQVLMLLAVGDMSYSDIAGHLAIPIGTVRSRIHRARAKARELLGSDESIPIG